MQIDVTNAIQENVSESSRVDWPRLELPVINNIFTISNVASASFPHVDPHNHNRTTRPNQHNALKSDTESAMMDASRILEGLNEAQKSAVTSDTAVLQILAPPGSGKTKTLTSRVSWLLFHKGYKPWNVVCLTFTIKSAREMKERIAKQIGQGLEARLVLGTFHSVCLRYLRSYGHLIGLPKNFDIAETSDSQAIVKRIIKQKQFLIDPATARSRISHCKSKNKNYLDVQREQKKSVEQQEFVVIWEAYQTHLEAAKLLDYDDLLIKCAELLRSNPRCVSNVEAVLIDEFQDTNNVQFELVQLFSRYCKRITTVGDPDQSIYGWRSAEIENLKRMQRIYPETLVLNLENNYRSSPQILKAAQMVIEQDESRPAKTMVATHKGVSSPVLRLLHSPKAQASWIVTEIKRCRAATGNGLLDYTDFAILIRSASLSRQIETAMGNAGIPYRMVGGLRFFDRKEIKVLLDYVRVVNHPENNDAIARIINYPPRGIGEKSIKMIQDKGASSGRLWWELIVDEVGPKKPVGLKDNITKSLRVFHNIIATCREAVSSRSDPVYPLELLELVIKKLNFEDHLKKEYPEDYEQRWANVEELKLQASEYGVTETEPMYEDPDALPQLDDVEQTSTDLAQAALSKFLGNIALSTELQSEQECDEQGKILSKVTISTIHAAKGLEWPVVFIPSVYKGSIPHSRSDDEDEERRLLYVAMTRAQALLYMTCPSQGQMSEDYVLSPFLDERNVRRCLTNRAPSVYDQVQEISSILRRECPSAKIVSEAITALTCIEDDDVTWPLNGSKGAWKDGSENPLCSAYALTQNRCARDSTEKAISAASAVTGNPMGSSSAIIQPNFVSATTQLKRALSTQEEWQRPRPEQKAAGASKRPRSNKVSSGQRTLGLFFKKIDSDSPQATELDLPAIRTPVNCELARTKVQSLVEPSARNPDFTDSLSLYEPRITADRLPMAEASRGLINRRVCAKPGLQRHKSTMDEFNDKSRHHLVSSSPTKPEPNTAERASLPAESITTKSATYTVTSQQTTMSIMSQQSTTMRRNLGIGRALKPWNSASSGRFSVPKISKPPAS